MCIRDRFTDQEAVDLSHIRQIILDTGAGVCLIGREQLQGMTEDQFKKVCPPLNLTTANGSVKARHEIVATVSQLREPITFMVLEKSPTVISLGLFCEEWGWTFAWEGYQRPYLQTPDGKKRVYLYTKKHVPYLLSAMQEIDYNEIDDIRCYQCLPALETPLDSNVVVGVATELSLIHISEPTRPY